MESLQNKDKKTNGSLSQKLFSIFRNNSHSPREGGSLQLQNQEREMVHQLFSGNILSIREFDPLSQDQLLARRRDFLLYLKPGVISKSISPQTIDILVDTIIDMLEPNHPTDIREAALSFLCSLTTGQYTHFPLRARMLNLLIKHPLQEDEAYLKIKLLIAATRNACDVAQLAEEVIAFLLIVLDNLETVSSEDINSILISFVTSESSDLSQESLSELIAKVSDRCLGSVPGKEYNFLPFFHATLSRTKLPQSALPSLIQALCYNVTISQFSEESWNITQLTIAAFHLSPVIRGLCEQIEQSYSSHETVDGQVTRGAILLLSYSLWGPRHRQASSTVSQQSCLSS